MILTLQFDLGRTSKSHVLIGMLCCVSWCFEPSQPQRITSGLKAKLGLSPSYS